MTTKSLGRALIVVVILFIPFLWPVGLYLGWKWHKEGEHAALGVPAVPVVWANEGSRRP